MSDRFNLTNATPTEKAAFWAAAAAVAEPRWSRTFKRVPILKVGEWMASRSDGKATGVKVTREDIAFAAEADASGKLPGVVLGITHPGFQASSNGKNMAPAVGAVDNLTPTDGGDTLVADIHVGPKWLADKFEDAYPRRSADWWQVDGGAIVHRVSLLGTDFPAIHTLDDIRDVLSDEGPPEGVPDGALAVAAAFDVPAPTFDASASENQPDPNGPDHTGEQEPTMTVDTTELRASLPPEFKDADDATVIAEATKRLVASAEADTAHEAQETVEVDAVTEPVAIAAGAIDADTIAQIQAGAAEIEAFRAEQRQAKLDAAIERCVKGGGFAKTRGEHWVQAAALDFDGTIAALEAHPLGLIPVDGERGVAIEAAATSGAVSDEDFYKAVYGEEA